MRRAKTFEIFMNKLKSQSFLLQSDKERILTESAKACGAPGFVRLAKEKVCTQRTKLSKNKLYTDLKMANIYYESSMEYINVTKQ